MHDNNISLVKKMPAKSCIERIFYANTSQFKTRDIAMYKPQNAALNRYLAIIPTLLCVSGTGNAQDLLNDNFESYATGSGWHGKPNTRIIEDPTGEKGGKILQITMPKGKGPGITRKIALKKPTESACLSYDLYLAPGFEFETSRKRGKLPGLAGGDTPTGCANADSGFSNRFHWIENGGITQYQYFPGKKTSCGTHTKLGSLTTGKWHTLRSCIAVGSAGKADGKWQSWLDGNSTGEKLIQWRLSDNILISDVLFHAFYSHDKPTKDINIYFDNLKVVEGNELFPGPSSTPAPAAPSGLEVEIGN